MMPQILLQNPNNNKGGRDMEMKHVYTYITGFFGKTRFAAHQTVQFVLAQKFSSQHLLVMFNALQSEG